MQPPTDTRTSYWRKNRNDWLAACFEDLTSEIKAKTPSELAEEVRYLPPSNTTLPGPFRFDVCPYMREPLDCLGVENPVREIAFMKGVQLCVTTALLENGVLYNIAEVKTSPVLFATATLDLARTRLEGFIIPMLQQSKLGHLIQSSDDQSRQKTGKTKSRIEFIGGGRMDLIGANSTAGMRSLPIRFLYRDEIDDWEDTKDGDSIDLTTARTKTFEDNRKIIDISTPRIKGTSKVEKQFLRGDQRHFFIKCLGCGHQQTLSAHRRDPEIGLYGWRHTNPDTGEVTGFVWDTDENGLVVLGSVRWLCHYCGHAHTNDDKTRMLAQGEWHPTTTPQAPYIRSYHLSAFYSPVGMQTWESCVRDFLEAWDVQQNEVKDQEKLQVFYNNVLGETYEIRGEKLTTQQVSKHRRSVYRSGEIPNRFAKLHTGSPVLFASCTVDVHKTNLAVARWGYCRDTRLFILDYQRFEGEVENPEDAATWGRLEDAIGHTYKSDDGKNYGIELALIDAGYLPDQVQTFCARMGPGVYPIVGRGRTQAGGEKHFKETSTATNTSFVIGVDLYKDRWGSALRRSWSGDGIQPSPFLNAPADLTDKQLKELTVEKRLAFKRQTTGEILYYSWHRPNGVDNELWDLLVYANAAHDILATAFCREELGVEDVSEEHVKEFWDVCEQHGLFFFD